MAETMQETLQKAARRSETDQGSLATAILTEIESEEAWESAFS